MIPIMNDALASYIRDHLAGARFALELLENLGTHAVITDVASLAQELQSEIETDRLVLQTWADQAELPGAALKEATAWLAEKLGRGKLVVTDLLGQFEAIELLCLGVHGKLALWNSLRALQGKTTLAIELPLDDLVSRAVNQHARLECLRLQLAPVVLGRVS